MLNKDHFKKYQEFKSFVHPHVEFNVTILGYFPYETARVSNELPKLPKELIPTFDCVNDNKYVLIGITKDGDQFAIFYHDGGRTIGSWTDVTHYDVCKALKLKSLNPVIKYLQNKLDFIVGYYPYDYTATMGNYALEVKFSTSGDNKIFTTKSTNKNVHASSDFETEQEYFDTLIWLKENLK